MASQASPSERALRSPRGPLGPHPPRPGAGPGRPQPVDTVFPLDPLALPLGLPQSAPNSPHQVKGDFLWLGHSWGAARGAPLGRRLQDSRYEPFGAPPPSPQPSAPPQPVAMPDAARLDRERDWERRARNHYNYHHPLVHQRASLDGHLPRGPHHVHHHNHRDGTQTVTLTAELGPPQLPPPPLQQHQLTDKEVPAGARSAGPCPSVSGDPSSAEASALASVRARTPPVPPVKFCASSVKARLESSPSSRPCSGPSPTPTPTPGPGPGPAATPRPGSDQPERAELRYEPPAVVCSLELLEPVLEPLRSEIVFHTSPLADAPPPPSPAPVPNTCADTNKALEALDEATQNLLHDSEPLLQAKPAEMLEPVRLSVQYWPGGSGGPQRAVHHLPEPLKAPQKASPTYQQRPQQASPLPVLLPPPPSGPAPPPPQAARCESPVYQEPFQGPQDVREESPVYAQPYRPSPATHRTEVVIKYDEGAPISEHFERTCVTGPGPRHEDDGDQHKPSRLVPIQDLFRGRKENSHSLTRRLIPSAPSSEDDAPTLKGRGAHPQPHPAHRAALPAVDVRSCLNLMACRLPQNQQSLEEDAEAEGKEGEAAALAGVVAVQVPPPAPSPAPSSTAGAGPPPTTPLFQHRRLSAPAPLSSPAPAAVPQMAVVQSSWWPVVQPSPSPAWNWVATLPVPPPPPPAPHPPPPPPAAEPTQRPEKQAAEVSSSCLACGAA